MKENKFNITMFCFNEFERYKIYDKPILIPDNNGQRGIRGQAKNREKSIRQSMSRTKEKIFGYVMANNFEYWATQTFNFKKVDRYDLDEIVKRYNQKLYNLKKRNYPALKWLIVPENHKDGAWHLHMFISGIPQDKIVYSGYNYFNKKKRFFRKVYNWVDTIDYGFNDYIYIGDIDDIERYKIALYMTKYITKDLATIRFNKKMFWSSKGLLKSLKTNIFVNTDRYEMRIKESGPVLNENSYFIKDAITGEVFNYVSDITIYKPIPF